MFSRFRSKTSLFAPRGLLQTGITSDVTVGAPYLLALGAVTFLHRPKAGGVFGLSSTDFAHHA